MLADSSAVPNLPNQVGRIMLTALEEIIGHNGMNAVLNSAHLTDLIENYPPNDLERNFQYSRVAEIMAAMEGIYGVRAGRGLAMRAGGASFKYFLRENQALIGLNETQFRLLPLAEKLRSGLKRLASFFNHFAGWQIEFEEAADRFVWRMIACPLCWQRYLDPPDSPHARHDGATCHWMVGLLQEALYAISGGKYFNIEETACQASGAPADLIAIDKQPLD